MRNEIKREHCSCYKSYKAFYDNQASSPRLSKIRKSTRMKPINWAVTETLNLKKPPCKVLDVGCQHGIIELILAALWYDVTALDVSEKYIEASKGNTSIVNEYINYRLLPIERIKELNEKFQVVIALSVLEHVIDFDKALFSMMNAADDDALLLSIVPIGKSWLSEEHTRIFTDANICSYFPKGSEISKIKFSDDPKMLGWFAVKYIKGEHNEDSINW